MQFAQVQFNSWDKVYNFSLNELAVVRGDFVIVETELGTEIGKIACFKDIKEDQDDKDKKDDEDKKCGSGCGGCKNHEQPKLEDLKPIIRKATAIDLEKITSKKEKEKAIKYCKEMVTKHELEMKLVDVHFSFDESRITFAFIADGRVDFRELVKDLTRHFNRTVRLHQIGIRDEAKLMGECGHCGRELCCKKFLNDLTSITSEMAEVQQCVHRGSDRISGICGRLMCCLAYEEKGYENLAKNLPPVGTKVNVDGRRGEIISQHILKQTVDVKFLNKSGEGKTIIEEIDINRHKK